jgi:hypothetical protein
MVLFHLQSNFKDIIVKQEGNTGPSHLHNCSTSKQNAIKVHTQLQYQQAECY